MKFLYYIGEEVAYFFVSNDGIRLIPDIIVDKDLIEEGKDLLKKAYQNENITYEEIKVKLDVDENILTLKDLNEIINSPNEKNYGKFDSKLTIDAYSFLKNIKKNINNNIEEKNDEDILELSEDKVELPDSKDNPTRN